MSYRHYLVEKYNSFCTCPVCGGKMTPAEHYAAQESETITSQNYTLKKL